MLHRVIKRKLSVKAVVQNDLGGAGVLKLGNREIPKNPMPGFVRINIKYSALNRGGLLSFFLIHFFALFFRKLFFCLFFWILNFGFLNFFPVFLPFFSKIFSNFFEQNLENLVQIIFF